MSVHKVNNVEKLYADAKRLYSSYVVGGDASADTVLLDLEQAIENLKNSWKGIDAGVQINNVIRVYNAMVLVRNSLAQLAVDSSTVAANYRMIQLSNNAPVNEFVPLTFDSKVFMTEHADAADTIDITPEANNGKNKLDVANTNLDAFASAVNTVYYDIMDNWQSGPGRDSAVEAFETFNAYVNDYKQVLAEASTSVTTALRNYGLL